MEKGKNHSEKSFQKDFSVKDKEHEMDKLSIEELKERIKNLEEILKIEIEKRDKIIKDLKKKNELLLKTALKQSMKNEELKVLFERMKNQISNERKEER
jgi:ribosomal protein L15